MAKMTFRGLDEYIAAIERLGNSSDVMIKRSVYQGAKIVADSVKAEMQGIKTRPNGVMYRDGKMAPGPREDEKRDMIASFGLAKMRNDGDFINTKAGFDGYSSHRTKSFPTGVPIPVIARSCESGTSWMRKQPFMRNALNKSRNAATEAIRAAFEEELKQRMQ